MDRRVGRLPPLGVFILFVLLPSPIPAQSDHGDTLTAEPMPFGPLLKPKIQVVQGGSAQREADHDPESPHAFKGLPLGSPESLMHSRYPWGCDPKPPNSRIFLWLYDRNCTPMKDSKTGVLNTATNFGTYGGIPPRFFTLYYWHDQLSFVRLVMDQAFYETVTQALTERYGKPTSVGVDTIQNRLGSSFEQRVYSWERPLSIISAARFGEDLTKSEVHYRLRAWIAADSAARAADQRARTGDM